MENPKRSRHLDRLSELPDSLIFNIFWLLPMTDVVRTSLLSRRWRCLWTNTPFLNFDAFFFDYSRLWQFVNQLNRALLWWNGNRVLKFKFHSRQRLLDSMFRDVDMWVNFAKRNGVQELHLHAMCNTPLLVYSVPQCLYSCSSLKVLTLEHCLLEISGNMKWNQLERLQILDCRVTADVINKILSGIPQLRVFEFRVPNIGGKLSIQSTSLKELFIWKQFPSLEDLSSVSVCAPNLETLEIKGITYSKCLLTNFSCLRRATLGLLAYDFFHRDGRFLNGAELSSANALSAILATIKHAENVTLSTCCTKVLIAMRMKCTHSFFPNVKSLEISCCIFDYQQVLGILQMFPQLERLFLRDQKGYGHQDDQQSLKFEAYSYLPKSLLKQLRTIEVTWAEGYNICPLIEIMLKYTSKVEKIMFQFIETKPPAPPSDPFVLVSQELLRMRRSSPNCTIDLIKLSLLGAQL